MGDNIYASPRAKVETYPATNRKGSPIKAIVIGVLVDIGSTLLFGMLVGLSYGLWMVSQGMGSEEIESTFLSQQLVSIYGLSMVTAGLSFSILSGYVCARIVNYKEYKFATLLSVVTISLTLLMGATNHSLLENIVLNLLTIIAVLLGAMIHVKRKAR